MIPALDSGEISLFQRGIYSRFSGLSFQNQDLLPVQALRYLQQRPQMPHALPAMWPGQFKRPYHRESTNDCSHEIKGILIQNDR